MNKFVVALATVVSLCLAIPAFAQEKNDAPVPAEKMGKQDKMVVHHHYHHHHYYMMVKPKAKPQ
jgi:hypothetical protein